MDFRIFNLLYQFSKEYNHKELRPKDISETGCQICTYVYSNPGCTQTEVSVSLKMDKTTLAKALVGLIDKGLIERVKDEVDKRVNHLFISRNGKEKIEGIVNLHSDWFSQVTGCLTEDEQKQFDSYCERLLKAAKSLSESKTEHGETNA